MNIFILFLLCYLSINTNFQSNGAMEIQYPGFDFIKEVTFEHKNTYTRGLRVEFLTSIDSFTWQFKIENDTWKQLSGVNIGEYHVYVELDDRYIGKIVNLKLNICKVNTNFCKILEIPQKYCVKNQNYCKNIFNFNNQYIWKPKKVIKKCFSCWRKLPKMGIYFNPYIEYKSSIIGTKDEYLIHTIYIPEKYIGFYQMMEAKTKKLSSIIIVGTLNVSIKESVGNGTFVCVSSAPVVITTFQWSCKIDERFIDLKKNFNYDQTKYSAEEFSILKYIILDNQYTLRTPKRLPYGYYLCYCEASLRAYNEFESNKETFSNFKIIPLKKYVKEYIIDKKNKYRRGFIFNRYNIGMTTNVYWKISYENNIWKNVSRNDFNESYVFFEINDRFVNKNISLNAKLCQSKNNVCKQKLMISLIYCKNEKFQLNNSLVKDASILEPMATLGYLHSCSQTSTYQRKFIFNPDIPYNLVIKRIENHYFLKEFNLPTGYNGFFQFGLSNGNNSKIMSLLIFDQLKISIRNSKSELSVFCDSNLPSFILTFNWSCTIHNQLIEIKDFAEYSKKNYSYDTSSILKNLKIDGNQLWFTPKLPFDFYECHCQASLSLFENIISSKQNIILDINDPIIRSIKEIIMIGSNIRRGLLVSYHSYGTSINYYWKFSIEQNNWTVLPRQDYNLTHFFIEIEDRFINKKFLLIADICTYDNIKCNRRINKSIEYCPDEKIVYMYSKIKDKSIWKPMVTLAFIYSCSQKLSPNPYFMFYPSLPYESMITLDSRKYYFVHDFYLPKNLHGFYQFGMKNETKGSKKVLSIVIMGEVMFTLTPNNYEVNSTHQCKANMPDNIVTYKWSCFVDNELIELKEDKSKYKKQSKVLDNINLKKSDTIHFGSSLPGKLYSCKCTISCRVNYQLVSLTQNYMFDFKYLYMSDIITKYLNRPFPYWIFIMLLFYLCFFIVFGIIGYFTALHLIKLNLLNVLQHFYRKRTKKSKFLVYKTFHTPLNYTNYCLIVRSMIKELNFWKKLQNNQIRRNALIRTSTVLANVANLNQDSDLSFSYCDQELIINQNPKKYCREAPIKMQIRKKISPPKQLSRKQKRRRLSNNEKIRKFVRRLNSSDKSSDKSSPDSSSSHSSDSDSSSLSESQVANLPNLETSIHSSSSSQRTKTVVEKSWIDSMFRDPLISESLDTLYAQTVFITPPASESVQIPSRRFDSGKRSKLNIQQKWPKSQKPNLDEAVLHHLKSVKNYQKTVMMAKSKDQVEMRLKFPYSRRYKF